MTLRQLVWMRDARQRDQWNHTSMLAAIIANTVRDSNKRPKPFSESDFHPFHKRYQPKPQKTAAQLFAKLANWPGVQAGTVQETTWKPKQPPHSTTSPPIKP